jgi:hypothetical protein
MELKNVESLTTTREEARKFAADGKLAARKLEYLPVPEAAR